MDDPKEFTEQPEPTPLTLEEPAQVVPADGEGADEGNNSEADEEQ